MSMLFIADLHLSEDRPSTTALFLEFLDTRARDADAVYILGDLFEYWAGDDAAQPHQLTAMHALRNLADSGVPVFFMHGNRDFLIGAEFAAQSGCRLLPDPTIIDLYGRPVLLMHGDTLCTDDHDYQKFRAMVRNPGWQHQLLARPAAERIAIARQYRAESKKQSGAKAPEIMDVNQHEVQRAMRAHDVRLLIHGHTHRPALHTFRVATQTYRRAVLGDWHATGTVLIADADGYRLERFAAGISDNAVEWSARY